MKYEIIGRGLENNYWCALPLVYYPTEIEVNQFDTYEEALQGFKESLKDECWFRGIDEKYVYCDPEYNEDEDKFEWKIEEIFNKWWE